jgi:hypothetical protein
MSLLHLELQSIQPRQRRQVRRHLAHGNHRDVRGQSGQERQLQRRQLPRAGAAGQAQIRVGCQTAQPQELLAGGRPLVDARFQLLEQLVHLAVAFLKRHERRPLALQLPVGAHDLKPQLQAGGVGVAAGRLRL